jgi:hypothetical protein
VITRIESGEVKKPNRDVLARIARWAAREPAPLMFAAGHLSADEFRNAMKPLFVEGGPRVQAVADGSISPRLSLEEIDRRLRSPQVDPDELDELAEAIFSIALVGPGHVERTASIALLAGNELAAANLGEIIDAWGYVGETSQQKLLLYARSLRDVADLEYEAEQRRRELDTNSDGERS